MSESVWDELKPTWRDAIVLSIGFAAGLIVPSRVKQYLDKRDIEQAERIANYLQKYQSNPSISQDISKLYQSLENLTKRIEALEKRDYRG